MNRLHTLFLIICALIIIQGQIVNAETWIENFSNNLDSWKEYDDHFDGGIWAPKTIWEAKGGRLDVWIDPPPTPGIYERFPLEFIGFPIKAKELNVKVKILEATSASVGILIGQYDDRGSVLNQTIKFLHRPFFGFAIRRSPRIDMAEVANKVDKPPFPLKDIEISFEHGHFKFFSERKLLIEFDVPQLPIIDCIGIIAYVERGAGVIGEFVLDDFEISAPTFYDVSPKSKAAVLWGELKRQ